MYKNSPNSRTHHSQSSTKCSSKCLTMIPIKSLLGFVALLLLCISDYASAVRRVNITKLDNCAAGSSAPMHLTELSLGTDPITGLCDTVHGKFVVSAVDTSPKLWIMTIYKCPADTKGPCNDNEVVHEEEMDCRRFLEDTSGPWSMFSGAMSGSKCGEEVGSFSLDYSILKLDHLINYLDTDHDQLTKFRFEMDFLRKDNRALWACGSLEFNLVDL